MSRLKILLAEDDSDHQHLLQLALRGQGQSEVEVLTVDTGAGLLTALGGGRFDCVVVDFNLPDYHADELIRSARNDLGSTPVIVISSCDDQAVVIDSMRSGVVDFVPKSLAVTGEALRRSVERAVAAARRQQAERRHTERRERSLAHIAETDPLTGLFNRRFFHRCLEEGRWSHDRRAATACLMVDIDHFKAINDTHGHNAGDQVLQSVAKAVGDQAGGGSTAFRWGGEEFVVLKPASMIEAWSLAEKIRSAVAGLEFQAEGGAIKPTVSVGLTHGPTECLSPEMVDRADRALYLAKATGRDRVCTWKMVEIKRLSEQVRDGSTRQAEACRRALLSRLAEALGPTQWEHMTNHSDRVSQAAQRIGGRLGLPAQDVEVIRLGGLYHDMGKCMIPEELLALPRRLTTEEWRIMAKHAELGAHLGNWLGVSAPIQEIVRHHHARYDAGPGLSPLGARILCGADALVTMVTGRPYAQGRSLAGALAEMGGQRGSQFDPCVVDAAQGLDLSLSMAA